MSNQNGDAPLNRAWRQASDEQPPAQLDAAIVAAAHKAIQDRDEPTNVIGISRRSRSWLTGWQPLAAAAGVAGLAFILVQTLPLERDVAPSIQMDEAVSGPADAPESVRSPAAAQVNEEKAAAAEEPLSAEVPVVTRDREEMKRVVPPPPPAPVDAPRAASVAGATDQDASADDTTVRRAAEADQRQRAMPEMSGQAALEATDAPARQRSDVSTMSGEDWAARVEALYASGDVAGAAETLRAFRVANPQADTYLPESLRDWARTVE